MSRPLHCLRYALLAATMLAPVVAHAADLTPDQAVELQGNLRGWLASLLGPKVKLSDKPIQVTADGDHFRLAVDVSGPIAGTPMAIVGGPVTATAKPLGGTRWSIDNLRQPSPLKLESAKPADTGLKSISLRADEQTSHGEFDTATGVLTTYDSSMRGYSSATEKPDGTRITSLASLTSHLVSEPVPGGGVNLRTETRGEKLASEDTLPDGTPFKLTAEKLSLTVLASNVAFDQVGPIIRGFMSLIPDKPSPAPQEVVAASPSAGRPEVMVNAKQALLGSLKLRPAPAPRNTTAAARSPAPVAPAAPVSPPVPPPVAAAKPDMTPEQRATAHQLLASVRAFMGGLDEQIALEGLRVDSSGHIVSFSKIAVGFGFGAPQGKMEAHMTMTVDGLNIPELPPGAMRDYVPTHITMRPRVSGVPAADVFALADHAIDTASKDTDALSAEAIGLLAKGPLSMGVDDLAVTMGPATLKGGGEVLMASITDIKGKASFTATGLDELIKQVNATPELQQVGAGPVLFLLKGMGRTAGAETVWDVTYADGKVMVNDTDLSTMIPKGK